MKIFRAAVVGMILLGTGQWSGGEPRFQQQQTKPGFPGMGHVPGEDVALPPDIARKQAQSMNNERQKRLVEDTDKLLELATELKQEVDKTNKDVMSVEVIKKADEIEKLAKSVKDKMKG